MSVGIVEVNKIPSSCYDCKFCTKQKELGELICLADNEMRSTNFYGKKEWCPIKAVSYDC